MLIESLSAEFSQVLGFFSRYLRNIRRANIDGGTEYCSAMDKSIELWSSVHANSRMIITDQYIGTKSQGPRHNFGNSYKLAQK